MMWVLVLLLSPSIVLWYLACSKGERLNKTERNELPLVSIVIAVRNEEHVLPQLFNSLSSINYPQNKLQILFGNDCSNDSSNILMERMVRNNSHCKLVQIKPTEKHQAKANVLMQLCDQTTGDFLFFLDADVLPNKDIIRNYLDEWCMGYGGITGVTLPKSTSLFSKLQRIDWCFALSIFSDANKRQIDATAMGNNMFVSREAYEAVGGYESLPKSLVEDFTLYQAIRQKGFSFPVIFSPKLFAETGATRTVKELLKQRKRWMSGLQKLKPSMAVILFTQSLFYLCLVGFMFLNPLYTILLWLVKVLAQSFYLARAFKQLNLTYSIRDTFFYEVYNCIFVPLLGIYYLFPSRVTWKNRVYEDN